MIKTKLIDNIQYCKEYSQITKKKILSHLQLSFSKRGKGHNIFNSFLIQYNAGPNRIKSVKDAL